MIKKFINYISCFVFSILNNNFNYKPKAFYKDINFKPIYESCTLSNIAYYKESDIQYTYNNEVLIYKQGFLIYKDDIVHLTFRGTNDLNDLQNDLKIDLKNISYDFPDTQNILVHTGFLLEVQSILPNIILDLEQINCKTIYISGHSLGGSMATIASLYIQQRFPEKNIIVHTFGSPRCGNIDFVNLFKEKIKQYYRITFHDDPIDEYPICKLYCHIGNCILLKLNGYIKYNVLDTPWKFRILLGLLDFNILNHSIDKYLSSIKS